jgi:hypothetical protein
MIRGIYVGGIVYTAALIVLSFTLHDTVLLLMLWTILLFHILGEFVDARNRRLRAGDGSLPIGKV